jgi:hypothetical protein
MGVNFALKYHQMKENSIDVCFSTLRKMRNVYRNVATRHGGKRSLGSFRHRWEYNIKMGPEGSLCENVN